LQFKSEYEPLKYIIGSGWWCADAPERQINPNRKLIGDDSVREVAFFEKWRTAIGAFSSPFAIVVVDSSSPRKPGQDLMDTVSWVELPFNARHSTDHLGQWGGWLRSCMIGANYALIAEADYFVYVEQDCLIGGDGIIEHCISAMTKGIMLGSGEDTPQPIQQSFFILERKRLAAFVKNLADLKADDKDLSPEWKFVYATWRPLVIASNLGLLRREKLRNLAVKIAKRFFYDPLPIQGGRFRPINFSEPFIYFQHGTRDEIATFSELFLKQTGDHGQP
jgi:hypothetical protein